MTQKRSHFDTHHLSLLVCGNSTSFYQLYWLQQPLRSPPTPKLNTKYKPFIKLHKRQVRNVTPEIKQTNKKQNWRHCLFKHCRIWYDKKSSDKEHFCTTSKRSKVMRRTLLGASEVKIRWLQGSHDHHGSNQKHASVSFCWPKLGHKAAASS